MLQFSVRGTHLGLQLKLNFMNLVIGWATCVTFVWGNEKDSCYKILDKK
jgi:hypothetical protein